MLKLYSADGGSKIKQEEFANCVFVIQMPLSGWEVWGMFSKREKHTHIVCLRFPLSLLGLQTFFYWGSGTILTVAQTVARYCWSCPCGGAISPFPSHTRERWKRVGIMICYCLVKLHKTYSFARVFLCIP